MGTRKPDFAGSWYPSRESDCRALIEQFTQDPAPCAPVGQRVVGGIVPHAGWFYSGKVACSVVRCLKESHSSPDSIVLFGRHLHPGSKNFIMKEGRWGTPLGELDIDRDLGELLVSEFPFVVETASSYGQDNTIELQLPFVKYFFPSAKILPVGVPPAVSSLEIGERVIEMAIERGRKVMVLGSTDLTHYGWNYGFTTHGTGEEAVRWVKEENDKKVVDLMLDMDASRVLQESLRNQNACCGGAAAAAIAAAKKLGATTGSKLFYTTSYDIRPDSSFVGYVGIVFS